MNAAIAERFVGYVSFPLSNYLLNRKHIISSFREFQRSEWYREDTLRRLQLERLGGVIEYAARHVPFYRKRFREIALLPQDIRSLEDVRLIPPLSRREVVSYYREMVDERCQPSIPLAEEGVRGAGEPIPLACFRKHKLVRNTSSGSTGAPTIFFEDGSRSALNWAYEMRVKYWYGIAPGAREARMARLSTAYLPESRSLAVRKHLWHQLILPGTNLADTDYELCLDKMREFRPTVLWGYTSALTGLADYIRRSRADISPFPLKLLITWAAPLFEHEQRGLKEVFGCPVTNIYGTREVGHIAALCPEGGLHVNQENLLVESEEIVAGGTSPRELLVTTLDASPMPFIRYRTGDVGEVAPSACGCGRGLQLLKELLGRTGEIFMTKEGRMISPNFWCRVFMSAEHAGQVRRFQVVYTKEKDLRIVIERGEGYSPLTEEYLRGTIAANFGPQTGLQICYVARIEPQISGKYQMVVKEA